MTTFGSRSSATSIAERSACTMVMGVRAPSALVAALPILGSAPILDLRGLALPAQMLRHVLVHVLEHRGDRRDVAVEERAVALGLLLRGGDFRLEVGFRALLLIFRPGARG